MTKEIKIMTPGQQLADVFLSGMPSGRVLMSALAAQIDALLLAAEQRGAEREEAAIERLARDLLARLSHDYGDAEDVDDEIDALFTRGERLLPVERAEQP